MTKQEILDELNELIHDSPVRLPSECMNVLKDAVKYIEEQASGESGNGVIVYSVEEGHGRTRLVKEKDGTFVLVFGVAEKYVNPGEIIRNKEKIKPLFGYELRDANHARKLADNVNYIAGVMEKGVAETEEMDGVQE